VFRLALLLALVVPTTASLRAHASAAAGPMSTRATIAGNEWLSMALKADGSLWTFGLNTFGQLGTATNIGGTNPNPTPVQVLTGVTAVAAGRDHGMALKADGSLWTFGYNSQGQLGTTIDFATGAPLLTPVEVMTGVTAIAAGESFSMALKVDGSLWMFGSFGYEQFAPPPTVAIYPNATPVRVMTGVAAIAAGSRNAMVVKADGSLWTFGDNSYGQLGRNPGASSTNPVMTGVTAVAAGLWHTMALKADGTLWAFGHNCYGQLGGGSNLCNEDPSLIPPPVQVMTGVAAVAAGATHSMALKTDGTLWTFGSNRYGELGTATNLGTAKPNTTPVQVMTGVTAIAAGAAHSLAVKADGTLWAFGSNRYGELGTTTNLGNPSQNPTPTPMRVMVGMLQPGAALTVGSSSVPVVPGRLEDSRPGGVTVDGQSQGAGLRPAGSVTEVQVTGRHGVPSGASAVVLNVTVTGAQGDGFVTVWPCGAPMPNASSLNFVAGQTIPNAVITQIGVNGRVCLYTSAATFLLADVSGFFPVGSSFVPLVPARLLDSRPGGVTVDGQSEGAGLRPAGSVTELQVTGRHGVPSGASAVVLNVTVTGAQGDGFVTVWPCGTPMPNASSLNFVAGQTIPNAVITQIGVDGKVCLHTTAATFLLADVSGFFPVGSSFVPLVPARLLDSRPGGATVDGQSHGAGLRPAGSVTEVQVTDRHGVPSNASAAVLNVTVTGAQGDGFVTVWPCGTPMPNASSLNFVSGQTIPNAVITQIGVDGKVCLHTTAATFLLADVDGYETA
jgi:alpha-tubulin suppressor-like RCC1 family protein